MEAGYSGTPLAKKLGIKEGHDVALLEAPDAMADWLAPLPDGVVDNKVCAISDVWSGLRLVHRVENRR